MTSPGTFSFGKSYVRISIQWEVLYILCALATTSVARPNTVRQKSEYCATARLNHHATARRGGHPPIAVHLGRAKWAGTQLGDFGPAQKRPGTIDDGPGQAREKAGPCHGPRRQPDGRHDMARLIAARHSPMGGTAH
jgi:hypothetical protein